MSGIGKFPIMRPCFSPELLLPIGQTLIFSRMSLSPLAVNAPGLLFRFRRPYRSPVFCSACPFLLRCTLPRCLCLSLETRPVLFFSLFLSAVSDYAPPLFLFLERIRMYFRISLLSSVSTPSFSFSSLGDRSLWLQRNQLRLLSAPGCSLPLFSLRFNTAPFFPFLI